METEKKEENNVSYIYRDFLTKTDFIEFKHEVKERFDKVDARFDKVDVRFDKIDAKFDLLSANIIDLYKLQYSNLKWIVMAILTAVTLLPLIEKYTVKLFTFFGWL